MLRLDPAWVRFAPLTSAGLVVAGGVLGVGVQAVNTSAASTSRDPVVIVAGRRPARCRPGRRPGAAAPGRRGLAAGRGRLPADQLGLHPHPRRLREVARLAPAPGPADHPRDHAGRRARRGRHGGRAARHAPRGRGSAVGHRHRARQRAVRQLLLVPPAPRAVVEGVAGEVLRRGGVPWTRRWCGTGRRPTAGVSPGGSGPPCSWPSCWWCWWSSPTGRPGCWWLQCSRPGRRARPGPRPDGSLGHTLVEGYVVDAVGQRRPAARRAGRRGRHRVEPPRELVPAPSRADLPGRHHGRGPPVRHHPGRTRGGGRALAGRAMPDLVAQFLDVPADRSPSDRRRTETRAPRVRR